MGETRRGRAAWLRAGAEGGDYGAFQGATLLEILQDGELFPFQATEVDGVVDAVNGEIDGSGFEARDGGNFFVLLALVHGITSCVVGDVGGRIVFDGEEEIVDRIVEIEETYIRLQAEAEFCGIGGDESGGRYGRQGGAIEGFDFGPFETDHIDSELHAAGGIARMFAEPGFEAEANVAHGERARRAIGEVMLRELIEAAIAENGAKAGKIVGEAVEDAEPILTIVDFETFEGREAIVGFDDFVGDAGERTAIGSDAAHAV